MIKATLTLSNGIDHALMVEISTVGVIQLCLGTVGTENIAETTLASSSRLINSAFLDDIRSIYYETFVY